MLARLRHSGNQYRRKEGSPDDQYRDNESAKYWLSVMNELKNRGVKDVLIICADGSIGISAGKLLLPFPKQSIKG